MKKITETNELTCEFCNKTFSNEKVFVKHMCRLKHRWMEREIPSVRIGFQAWLQFYSKMSMSGTKNKTAQEFIKSPYYLAFVKFGSYCVDSKVVAPPRYVEWLLSNQIKIDVWNKDTQYNKFLCEFLRTEDPYDAIARSVEACVELVDGEKIKATDCLRYINPNKVCYSIAKGKISPWVLYQSDSGVQFLSTLNSDHVKIVSDYIDPEKWSVKFKRDPEIAKKIKELLKDIGF